MRPLSQDFTSSVWRRLDSESRQATSQHDASLPGQQVTDDCLNVYGSRESSPDTLSGLVHLPDVADSKAVGRRIRSAGSPSWEAASSLRQAARGCEGNGRTTGHRHGKWQMIVVKTMARMARMVWLGRISAEPRMVWLGRTALI